MNNNEKFNENIAKQNSNERIMPGKQNNWLDSWVL